MWELSNNMNMSFSDSSKNNNSEQNNPDTNDLHDCENLDVSLYENLPPEESTSNEEASMQLHLSRQDSTSKESGYCTSEFMSLEETSFNLNSCDAAMKTLIDERFDCEILNFSEDEKPMQKVKLPMDFDSLITATLNSHALASTAISTESDLNTTPSFGEYQRVKRSFPTSKTDDNVERCLKIGKIIPEPASYFNPEEIKLAVQRSSSETNLTGDFSKTNYLPLVNGRHQDLKAIAASTMCMLLKEEFAQDVIFKIIDCRYPYEYDGGHITSAVNLFTKEMLVDSLLSEDAVTDTKLDLKKRYILIFHCEFSRNRAPTLYRFFRNFDRNRNHHIYPALNYPEMYLLEDGYKNFYMQYSELCSPNSYLSMNHPNYTNELSCYREKTKTKTIMKRQNLNA